ncbi:MAG TPA: helix-turn-helix domain-containing protein [Gammaproteobacteria bacterium]|nr:helix-turn-helix domain-containing protein [Gammaproteobacteria bacterium]
MSKLLNNADKNKGRNDAGPGELLRQAREARKFSIESVAERLHLAVEIIQALEKAEYTKLPAPTYIRGYLRSYATYVGIDGDKLVDNFNQIAGDMPPDLVLEAIPSAPQPGRKPDGTIVILSIVVVAALLALIGWLSIEEPGTSDGISSQPQEQTTDQMEHVLPEQNASGPLTSDTVASTPVTDKDELSGNLLQKTPPTSTTMREPEPAAIPGQLRLSLAFDGSSWVEVHDADNKRLLMRLARAGSRYNISGKPPLRVLLGNARVVRLMVNDKAFSHQAYIRGKVARFDIQAGSE